MRDGGPGPVTGQADLDDLGVAGPGPEPGRLLGVGDGAGRAVRAEQFPVVLTMSPGHPARQLVEPLMGHDEQRSAADLLGPRRRGRPSRRCGPARCPYVPDRLDPGGGSRQFGCRTYVHAEERPVRLLGGNSAQQRPVGRPQVDHARQRGGAADRGDRWSAISVNRWPGVAGDPHQCSGEFCRQIRIGPISDSCVKMVGRIFSVPESLGAQHRRPPFIQPVHCSLAVVGIDPRSGHCWGPNRSTF